MAVELETKIRAANKARDPMYMPLLGAWMVAFGCIRFVHLERSVVLYISRSTVHCFCDRGKQASKRDGFAWSIPAHFSNGWPWWQAWQAAETKLPEHRRGSCGMIFDHLGHAWAGADTSQACQQSSRHAAHDSWRRYGPMLALLLQWDQHLMLAL